MKCQKSLGRSPKGGDLWAEPRTGNCGKGRVWWCLYGKKRVGKSLRDVLWKPLVRRAIPCIMQLKAFDSEALEVVLEVNRLLSICIYVATLIHIPLFHYILYLIGNKSSILDGKEAVSCWGSSDLHQLLWGEDQGWGPADLAKVRTCSQNGSHVFLDHQSHPGSQGHSPVCSFCSA